MPHETWAQCYDYVYENIFGSFYGNLTKLTLDAICSCIKPPASVVDFGAGTGRISIPLAQHGYSVTTVEPCKEMTQEIQRKAKEENVDIKTVTKPMQDFDGKKKFDMAICVFTVLLYLLDEKELRRAMAAMANSVNDNGYLIIDIPTINLFRSPGPATNSRIDQNITITPEEDDTYTYHVEGRCFFPSGEEKEYEDCFKIRYWPEEDVWKIIRGVGFVEGEKLVGFEGTGSNYYIFKK